MEQRYKDLCKNIAAYQIKHSVKVGITGITSDFLYAMTSLDPVDDEVLLYFHRYFVHVAKINGYHLAFKKSQEILPLWATPFTVKKRKIAQHLRIMCPRCGQSNAVMYIDGMPTYESLQMVERGDAILLGCSADFDTPEYLCKCCHRKFGYPPFFDLDYNGEDSKKGFHSVVPNFSFESGGYFGPYFNLNMQYEAGEYVVRVIARELDDSIVYQEPRRQVVREADEIIYCISEKCFEKFIRNLYEKTFLAEWKHHYKDPYVCDGGWAEIQIGKSKYSISNDWPPYYKKLCSMVSKWFREAGYWNIHVF